MRFLHTSDWHLGRAFHGINLIEDQAYILEQFIDLAGQVKPDAVVVAGDVYDRSVPSAEAVKLLDEVLSKLLLDIAVPVILIAGNHDSPERLGFGSRLLAGRKLYIAGSLTAELEPVVLYDEYGPVYFAPLAYAEPAVVRDRLGMEGMLSHEQAAEAVINLIMPKIPAVARKVAVAHAFIAGGIDCESERPLSVGGSFAVGSHLFSSFNYTALGHLHNSQQAGGEAIRYSGSLLKYSFSEAGQQKGINLVELDELGRVRVEVLKLSPRRDVRCMEGYFAELMARSKEEENTDDYLSITLKDEVPILDGLSRLRQIYPNIMHLEYSHRSEGGQPVDLAADHRKMGEAELFEAFFEQMTEQKLTDRQKQEFADIVDELYREQREASI